MLLNSYLSDSQTTYHRKCDSDRFGFQSLYPHHFWNDNTVEVAFDLWDTAAGSTWLQIKERNVHVKKLSIHEHV